MKMLLSDDRARVTIWHAKASELAASVAGCDALITDPPYSARTHKGHDNGAVTANRAAKFAKAIDAATDTPERRARKKYEASRGERAKLGYAAWTPRDVKAFVDAWAPKTRGWFCAMTDHVLVPAWEAALERHDRYVFAPLACVEPGSRVRMSGDGPSNWSVWLIVSRPKGEPYSKWGAKPGAYVVPPGFGSERRRGQVTGDKPLWLMERIIEDYSRPGDIVCDPCCGSGTTLVAAARTNRAAYGADRDLETAKLAAEWVRKPIQPSLFAMGGGLCQWANIWPT